LNAKNPNISKPLDFKQKHISLYRHELTGDFNELNVNNVYHKTLRQCAFVKESDVRSINSFVLKVLVILKISAVVLHVPIETKINKLCVLVHWPKQTTTKTSLMNQGGN
jgi:hypothetical protein